MNVIQRFGAWLLGKDLNESLQQAIHMTTMQPAARRNTAELIQMYRVSPWLQAVTKKISQRFAAVSWQLYAVGNEERGFRDAGTLKDMGPYDRHAEIRRLKQAGEVTQIEIHPLLILLNTANPFMTGSAGRLLTQLYRDIVGESFWALGMNPLGVPSEFWPLPPSWVTDLPVGEDGVYQLQIAGQRFTLPKDDVIWFRDPDPADPYGRGAGTAESLTDEIETDEYAAQFVKTFFRNRAKPELLISIEGLDGEQLKEAKQRFENQHQGFGRAHRSWWHNTKIDVKELTQKFTDMELQQLRESERDTVINVFGVPPEQLGIVTSSNRATAHESENIMATSVLVPRLEPFREQLQEELVPRYDGRLILDYVSPVPSDRTFALEVMKAAPYMFTRADWRELAEFENRGEGDDVHLQPLNLTTVTAPEPDATGSSNIRELPAQPRPKELEAPRAKAIDPNGIQVVLESMRPETLADEALPVWNDELQAWGDRVLGDLNVGVRFDMRNPKVVSHLLEFGADRMEGINLESRIRIRITLVEGMQRGEGVRELAERLTDEFAWMGETRAQTIARTESVRSSSFGSFEAYGQSGIVEAKEWLHTPDEKVRPEHEQLGGQPPIPLRDDFEIDGMTAPYPGEFGIASMDINCRCAVAPVVDANAEPRTLEARDQLWKVNESERLPWEASATEAFRRAFQRQAADALKALERVAT